MRQLSLAVSALFVVGVLCGGSMLLRPVRAQSPSIDRPGDAKYTPTKLQWAALQLQIYQGQNSSSDSPVDVSYSGLNDGQTIVCLLQFAPDTSIEWLKTTRAVKQTLFDRYVKTTGWSWLRLQFQGKVLPRPTT